MEPKMTKYGHETIVKTMVNGHQNDTNHEIRSRNHYTNDGKGTQKKQNWQNKVTKPL